MRKTQCPENRKPLRVVIEKSHLVKNAYFPKLYFMESNIKSIFYLRDNDILISHLIVNPDHLMYFRSP